MPSLSGSLRRTIKSADSWFILVLLGLSLVLNVFQALHRTVVLPTTREKLLKIGTTVANVPVQTPDGQPAVIDWSTDSRPVLAYVFSPACGWCTRNLRSVQALYEAHKADYRFIGLSPTADRLREYVSENRIVYPVYTKLDTTAGKPFLSTGTPTTVLISGGKIQRVWEGAYTGKNKIEIEKQLNIVLPDVAPHATH